MSRAARLGSAVGGTPGLVALGLLAFWSVLPLAGLLAHVVRDGGSLTGSDGPFVADQLQYLAWVRDLGENLLASNRFDLAPSGEVFVHPMFALSGLAWKLGAGVQLAYLAWKPVAVAVLALGFAAYVRRLIGPYRWPSLAALLTALFFFSPSAPLVDWLDLLDRPERDRVAMLAGEMFPAGQLWGYLPTAIAVGLMPLFLLGVERLLDPGRASGGGRAVYAWTTAAGLLVSWLHPWQGATLLLIVAGLAAWGRLGRPHLALAIPVFATAAPLFYYRVLSGSDPGWELAQAQNQVPNLPLWILLVTLLPLMAVALFGLRSAGARAWASPASPETEPAPLPVDVQERALLLWPAAILVVYLLLSPPFHYHALEGMSLPLAILAVRGWRRFRLPATAGVVAVALATVPGMAFALDAFRDGVKADLQPYFLTDSESRALRFVATLPAADGVLSPVYLGSAVPALTGHRTWVGHPSWTPDFADRARQAEALFQGELGPRAARTLVGRTGARILLSDCRGRADLQHRLAPLLDRARRFGCATVYLRDP